jgi:hypothetical protein
MNCTNLKPQLPLAATGDLSSSELLLIQQHCDQCPGCATELKALQATLQVLTDAGPLAVAQLDVAAVYQDEVQRQARTMRRWRRTALGLSAAAALLLGLFGLSRLEVRFAPEQVVLRWGASVVEEKAVPMFVPPPAPTVAVSEDAETRLTRLEELVLALADDTQGLGSRLSRQERRDRQAADVLAHLARQLDDLRQETRRDRAGLYAALNGQYSPNQE